MGRAIDDYRWEVFVEEDEARDAREFTHGRDTRNVQTNGAGCGTTAVIAGVIMLLYLLAVSGASSVLAMVAR